PKGNVSKRHSKISSREGLVEVADLKSTNGTYVNGRKIADPVQVTASDKIYVGDFMIVLDSEMMASTGNGHSEAVSASRRLPVPPCSSTGPRTPRTGGAPTTMTTTTRARLSARRRSPVVGARPARRRARRPSR